MQARELLSVLPADLIKSILARREKLAAQLPKELELRQEENDRAYQLASSARATLRQFEADEKPDEEHLAALEKARNEYDEHESFRRRTDSRLKKLKHAIKDSEEAIQFWSEMGEDGWGHLLEDAERVRIGGASSYSEAKRLNSEKEDRA